MALSNTLKIKEIRLGIKLDTYIFDKDYNIKELARREKRTKVYIRNLINKPNYEVILSLKSNKTKEEEELLWFLQNNVKINDFDNFDEFYKAIKKRVIEGI